MTWKKPLPKQMIHRGMLVRWLDFSDGYVVEGMCITVHNITINDYQYSIAFKDHYQYVMGSDLEFFDEDASIYKSRSDNFDNTCKNYPNS